jgi:serine/threonine protein kinase
MVEIFNQGYKDIRKLGSGSFGDVFLVVRLSDQSHFAKKVIKR